MSSCVTSHGQLFRPITLRCRLFFTSHFLLGKGGSSAIWIQRHVGDPYVKKSRYECFRARSAFKLLEIDDKFHFLKPGIVAIDCGAAPGAWTQVIVRQCFPEGVNEKNGSFIISIDRAGISPIDGAHCIPFTDFTSPLNQAKIISLLRDREVDVICSDMCPNVTGNHSIDHVKSKNLVISALHFGVQTLKAGSGVFLAKLLNGSETQNICKLLEKLFKNVSLIKPPSSRDDSSEIFVFADKFKGIKKS